MKLKASNYIASIKTFFSSVYVIQQWRKNLYFSGKI